MGSNKSNGKANLVQIGTIIIGNGVTTEEAILDAQTRPGVMRFEVFPEEDYVALYGKYETSPEPAIPA